MKLRRPIVPAFHLLAVAALLALAACQTDSKQQVLLTDKTQVELRAIETRSFDTSDKLLTIRSVIATMQDLGFVIDKVDEVSGHGFQRDKSFRDMR